jgi:hypothetical protein
MTQQHLPDLNEILSEIARQGGFVTQELFGYLTIILAWLNIQFTHEELHKLASQGVDNAVTNFEHIIPAPEYQADLWRPKVDAGDLAAIPDGINMQPSPEYLQWVADNVKPEVPDFIPDDFE